MAKENKIINIIKSRIQMAENGTLFFNNSFSEFDDEYVGQILSDLAKDGIIHHNTSRGVYLKTEETRFCLVLTVTARAAFSASRCAAFFATGYSAGIAGRLSAGVSINRQNCHNSRLLTDKIAHSGHFTRLLL